MTTSWEFFTTLDYEWNVVRGRRPYRWTIWVCIDEFFFRIPLPSIRESATDRINVDLLFYTCVHTHNRDPHLYRPWRCKTDQLSGGYSVLHHLATTILTCCNFELWIIFTSVSEPSDERPWYLITPFTRLFALSLFRFSRVLATCQFPRHYY